MMQYEGSFDEKGVIGWTERPPKPPDLRHLQGAMFTDRIDLWQPAKKPRRARSKPLHGQPELADVLSASSGQDILEEVHHHAIEAEEKMRKGE